MHEIFRKFDIADVVPMMNVCKRFKRIAEDIFPSKIRRECIDFDEMVEKMSPPTMQHFLCVSGSSILCLSFNHANYFGLENGELILFKKITKFCTNLISFEYDGCCLGTDERIFRDNRPFFTNLKRLRIPYLHQIEEIISMCTQLVSLEIIESNGYSSRFRSILPAKRLPNLLKFEITVEDLTSIWI